MNPKLRGFLNTTWNEPRHFFFWLAMLNLCGFIAVLALTAVAGPWMPLGFLAVACILAFLVSLLAFMLAWIPPLRPLFSRLLRRRILVLAALITLVALFYAVEDWRGRQAWHNYKRAQEARGERFDLASVAPPPVPSDHNFFETPLWSDLHFVTTNGQTLWSDPNRDSNVIFSVFGPNGNNAPDTVKRDKEQRVDFPAWQAFYRGSNNVFAAPGGRTTNYFPVAKEPQTPAADVLLALSKFNDNRQLLIASSARPQARFWINYEAGFGMLLPHLKRVKSTAQYLSVHANASLKNGDHQTALEDLHLSFRLIEAVRNEPILISQLVRIAAFEITLQPLWEGLGDRLWTEPELTRIEADLAKLDFLADYQFAMRGERGCALWTVGYLQDSGNAGLIFDGPGPNGEPAPPADLELFLRYAIFRLIPSGWFDQNKLSLARLYERYLLPVVDPAQRTVLPAACLRAQSAAGLQHPRPYDMFSRIMLPSLASLAEKSARAQTSLNQARLACALERYRLANGQFPVTLNVLTPKFIETLPHDVITGHPFKYRRTDDGQFLLYSVGWNGTDDGGQIALTKNAARNWHAGDWVWRYPAGPT